MKNLYSHLSYLKREVIKSLLQFCNILIVHALLFIRKVFLIALVYKTSLFHSHLLCLYLLLNILFNPRFYYASIMIRLHFIPARNEKNLR